MTTLQVTYMVIAATCTTLNSAPTPRGARDLRLCDRAHIDKSRPEKSTRRSAGCLNSMLIDQALPPSRFFLQPAYAQQRRCTEFLGVARSTIQTYSGYFSSTSRGCLALPIVFAHSTFTNARARNAAIPHLPYLDMGVTCSRTGDRPD
jgi:hypothetical protein